MDLRQFDLKCKIIDNRSGSPLIILADILSDLTLESLEEAETAWSRERSKTADHADWNWTGKGKDIADGRRRVFGIKVGTEFQGLISLATEKMISPIYPNRDLIYVANIEAAPWNLASKGRPLKFQGVGTALLMRAVEVSLAEGCEGRIGLHALPDACDFYRKKRMHEYVNDGEPYFELDSESAQDLLITKG